MANGHSPSIPPDAPLTLITLGGAALVLPGSNGSPQVVLGPGKPLALLTYLSLTHGHRASREFLLDLLWADLEPEGARHALRQTIYYLRQPLGNSILSGTANELELGRLIRTDRDDFLEAVDRGDLESAFRLYGGPFLPNFSVPGGAEFDDWVEIERGRLRSIFHRSAETLARRYIGGSRSRDAQSIARRLKKEDPLSESARRLLIEAFLAAQDTLSAQNEADELEIMLRSESRTADAATRNLLAQVHHTGSIEPRSESASLAVDLIGREKIFSDTLASWTSAQSRPGRHLHFSGGAGLGKTRLLLDVAARLRTKGVRVHYLRCNPGERQIPCSFAAELARTLAELPGAAAVSSADAAALVSLSPAVSARYSAAQPDPSSGDEALRRRTSALVQLIRCVSEEHPMVIMLDDMHWLDLPTRTILRAVFDHVSEWPVLLITAARPSATSWLEGDQSRIHHLAPLTASQVAQVLTSLASFPDEPWAQKVPAAIHQATGGTPLLVLETIQLALERNTLERRGSAWHCPDPARLLADLKEGSALRHRIASLEPAGRDILLALALTGAPLSTVDLANLLGHEANLVETEIGMLEQRGFVQQAEHQWRPAHDEIAERATDDAPPEDVARIHLALGRLYSRQPHPDRQTLLRAAHHYSAINAKADLGQVYARWMTLARKERDGRRSRDLAVELLGEAADDVSVQRLVKSLPVWNRIRLSSAARVGMAGLVLLTIVASGFSFLPGKPSPVEAKLVFLAGRDQQGYEIPIRRDSWKSGDPLALEEQQVIDHPLGPGPVVTGLTPSPDGVQWAYVQQIDNVFTVDVYVHSQAGERLLVHAPRDDGTPSWSGDGSRMVIASAQWSPQDADDYDIAAVNPATGEIDQLTSGSDFDISPMYSPDSRQIGFLRRPREPRPYEVCLIRDKASIACPLNGLAEVLDWYGWYDESHWLIKLDRDGIPDLALFDIRTGDREIIDHKVSDAHLDPTRRWLVVRAERDGMTRSAWYVYPVGHREQERMIDFGEVPIEDFTPFWVPVPQEGVESRSLKIIQPPSSILAGTTSRLRAQAFNFRGSPIPDRGGITWVSRDTSLLSMDSTGTAHAHRAGKVYLVAILNSNRSLRDSTSLTVDEQTANVVLSEAWDRGIAESWIPFGDPRPQLATGPQGIRGFWNRGDGSYASGAYTRRHWSGESGIGISVKISAPITRTQWQNALVEIVGGLDSTALGSWDHSTTTMPLNARDRHPRLCGVGYPGGEGVLALSRLGLTGADGVGRGFPVDSTFKTGEWFEVVVQIFPDGRCGFAINGKPIWRFENPVLRDRDFAILLGHGSADTKVLIGPLEVWQGVRKDIDWDTLDSLAH